MRYNFTLEKDENHVFQDLIKKIPLFYPEIPIGKVEVKNLEQTPTSNLILLLTNENMYYRRTDSTTFKHVNWYRNRQGTNWPNDPTEGLNINSQKSTQIYDMELYIQGSLECMYYGKTSSDFYNIVEFDATEAREMLVENVDIEFEYFVYWFDIQTENFPANVSDALIAEGKDILTEIYSHSKFEVVSTEKQNNGDYIVTLEVTPMTVFDVYFEDYFEDNYEAYYKAYSDGYSDDMTEEEYAELVSATEEMWVRNIYGCLKAIISGGMPYGRTETIEIRVYQDRDDYYTFTNNAVSTIDILILSYEP